MTKKAFAWLSTLIQKGRRQRRRTSSLPWKKKILYYLPIVGFFLVILFTIFTLITFAIVAKDLPSPDEVVRREGFATRIYDRDEELLYDVFRQAKRTPVTFDEIPNELKWATIAIEDKDFYSHPGFSLRGIGRAMFNILFRGKIQGGSTLTQQLVKNVLLTSQRTLTRKYRELILTLQIERRYGKDEILQMYLNEAPYGGTAWGVGAAAEEYFNKPVSELSLVESAILAGLPQRPSVYSPFQGEYWKDRTRDVLRRMREDGYIDKDKEKETVELLDTVEFSDSGTLVKAPHFVMYVKKLLADRFGEEMVEMGGLKVITSLDLDLQNRAEEVVASELDKVSSLNITNGASIVMDPQTGQILAMVGSKDYSSEEIEGKFNVITQGLRQPGSTIKPVTYLTGFKKGYTPATLLMDTKTAFPVVGQENYVPVNYDGEYHGPMQVRYALGNSINVPAVKMLAKVGLESMLTTAEKMGMSTLAPTKQNLSRLGLSATLGGGEVYPIEMATAYLAFANGGYKKESVSILKVEDAQGKVIYEHKSVQGDQVLSSGEAYLISDILSDNQARSLTFGDYSGLVITDKKVAVKTGTTNDKRDNWAIGWTPNILVLGWVGNNDNSPMKAVASGISGATPIWRRIMIEAINEYGYDSFEVPSELVSVSVDRVSGYRAHDGFSSRQEYFIKGTEPTGNDPVHLKLKVCPQSGKLATPPQVAKGEYEEKEFFKFSETDPVSTDGQNRWQSGIDEWINSQEDSRYHPPNDYCEEGGLIEVTIDSPAHESTVESSFPVDIKVKGIEKITKVNVFLDGEKKKEFTSKPYQFDMTLDDGMYTLRVEAEDEEGNKGDREAKIGVNVPWNWEPSPTSKPTKKPTNIPTPSPTVTLSPTPTP